ncbi:MAG: PAS domain S-box protein [Candidatus Marinimicrobia bacterium]|nr:PAS domain S-box protein [Candidatus Neomarinimicrobiota bacterium]
MKDHLKTKAELIEELESLRRRIAEGSPSERATIEISLEDSERRYLSLVDQSPIAYEVYDSEGLQLKVNRAYEDMWGMKAEDSEGIFNVRTDPQVELLGLKPYVERAFTGESVKLPVFAWDPGKSGFPGRARWLSTRIYPLKDKSDNILNVVITHEDITESKLAEEARSLSEQRYRDLFSQANEGLLIMTLEGQLSELNKSFAEMHGYTVEELKNRDISELDVLQENAISSRADLIDHILAGNVARFEVEHYHKNGHIFPLSVTVSLVRIGDEQFFMSFHQDITERKQAEEKIKSTKLLLRSSLESQKDTIIFSIDKNYHYLFFNKAHREVMKSVYNKDVVIGMNILECITSDDDRQAAKEYYDRALTGETHSNIQEYGIEERSYFESFFNPMLNDKNEIVGATALARDITERKRAEEQIREKDIQFRKLSANLPDLIFQFTRRPDGSYYVPIASEGIKNIFGCSPEDVLEDFTPIGNVIYPEDAERVINDIEYSAKHLTFFTCEFRVQIPGKAIQWILSRSTPEKLDDGSITWYGFNADITLNKQAEKEIAASLLEAKQANQVKDQFIANISHEIRTPLNSIIGFSDLFRQRYGDLVNIKDKDIFDYITNSSNRLMRTVDSILNISQLDAGVIKIQPKELDLNTIIKAVIGEIKALADKKGLELTCSPTDEYAMVSVDNYCVHQAILNLVDNAIKYTNDGKVELKLTQKKDSFRLSIQDTGIGISKEYQKRIFDPYTQESEGFTKNFQGIGLGLALTKRYLDLNGVDFELKSEKNVGTTFTLIFPKYEGHEHA